MESGVSKKRRQLSFDDATRAEISEKYSTSLIGVNTRLTPQSSAGERAWAKKWADDEACVFIGCLEGIAETADFNSPREHQKRRKERLEAIANTLDTLIKYVRDVDDPALGFAMWRGMCEAVKISSTATNEEREYVQQLEGFPAIVAAHDLQHGDNGEMLNAFAKGFRQAIKDLPPLDKRMYDLVDQTASFIEDFLGRRNIPVTTSDTGLAGTALIATLELAEVSAPRAGYRIKLAKESPSSWQNFVASLKARDTRESEG